MKHGRCMQLLRAGELPASGERAGEERAGRAKPSSRVRSKTYVIKKNHHFTAAATRAGAPRLASHSLNTHNILGATASAIAAAPRPAAHDAGEGAPDLAPPPSWDGGCSPRQARARTRTLSDSNSPPAPTGDADPSSRLRG